VNDKLSKKIANTVEYDLVIIGGGINGAALARLAAFQGLRVVLFEAADFGQGASTNTSKLLHGGLRYLETFDFGLVRDAVHERANLLALAPHLVEQRRFLFPKTRLGRHWRPAIKAGMTLYDLLAGRRRLDPHRWVPPAELREREPHFLPAEEAGAYEYSDCSMDDARMVLENLVDARALGADIRNYHRFLGAERDAQGNLEVTVLDRLTQKEIVVACKHAALCLGAWTDQVAKEAFPGAAPQVRLSQGIHLVAEGLQSQACFILPVPRSKRYFFVFPWKGRHLIGTTETEVGEYPPDPVAPLEKEAEELRALCGVYFPDQKPEFICAFAGLRPLARTPGGSTITLSREHEFHRLAEGVCSAVGGKYTTHRTFAREFLRFILGKDTPHKDIGDRKLPGAWADAQARDRLRAQVEAYPFVDKPMADVWMGRYGLRALELAGFIAADPARSELLPGPYSLLAGEVQFSVEREWTKTPIDFLRRRTDIYFNRGGGMECLEPIAAALSRRFPDSAGILGRDADYPDFLKRNRHRAAIPTR
jgi:glycerol-3-phosphate dehydrogenase